MTSKPQFPALTNWEATRQTLHLYSRAIGVVPRAHVEFHPKWWHISLKVEPDGLNTTKMPRSAGGSFWLAMDLKFGDQLLAAVAELGLSAGYARDKFENDDAREYDPEAAGRYLTALTNADRIFKEHRAALSGEVSPVQLWPHNFDLAFEWFGTRVERYEEHGQVQEYPSQINLGFYPGDGANAPYFYSNPWPFEADVLTANPLPEGARWFTEDWSGSILPYDELAEDERAEERLKAYARAVYDIASPTLLAET
jgi:hypothetical protein